MPEPTTREAIRLLNPAFTGTVVLRAAQGFAKETTNGLPFIYAFLVLPLVLHSETREQLPGSVATALLTWTERNNALLSMLPRRLADLVPATKAALFLLTTTGLVEFGRGAAIKPAASEKPLLKYQDASGSHEVKEILRKSFFVGRWLAGSGTPSTVLTAMGVILEGQPNGDHPLRVR